MKNVKPVQPGRMNKRVRIYRYKDINSGLSSKRPVLYYVDTVWAELRPTRGTEFLEYYRDSNALQFKVTMRYRPDLTEKDVLVYGERQFEINAVINIMEANIYLEIFCTESKDKRILYEPVTETEDSDVETGV